MAAWSDLPNAKHIDFILADLEKNPAAWVAACVAAYDAAWVAAYDAAWVAAWVAARAVAYHAARNAAWVAARVAAWEAARALDRDTAREAACDAARGAISCLIAHDDCSHYLKCDPNHLKTLAALGIDEALLLLPAVIASFNEIGRAHV